MSISRRRDQRILEKRKHEDKEEEESKQQAEEKRLQETKSNQMNQKRKSKKKQPKRMENKKVENSTKMELDMDVKELPPSVKRLHPNCLEFVVPGNGACCLNCLAAFIYLNPQEGPALGRDLNTHMATYRPEYLKRLSFPRSVTIGNGKILNFKEGEEN